VNERLEMIKELARLSGIDLRFCINILEELSTNTRNIVEYPGISENVHELEQIFNVFNVIREILGQGDKPGAKVRNEIHQYLESIKNEHSLQNVYKIMEKRFRMYDAELYIAYDNKYVPRTNNDLEDFNNCLKRPIRKGQGKRESWFYVEHQGESAGFYHNLLNASHNVGGTKIEFNSEKTPLERIGVLDEISVTGIMSLIDRELFYKNLLKNDELYTVHRWTRRIFKKGLDTCLSLLESRWGDAILTFQEESNTLKGRS